MKQQQLTFTGTRFSAERNNLEVGHAYVYLLHNDLHAEPFALIEDIQVDETHQGEGVGRELIEAVMSHSRERGCYKIIATSRNDGTRASVHDWYGRLGFQSYGTEFRMDL